MNGITLKEVLEKLEEAIEKEDWTIVQELLNTIEMELEYANPFDQYENEEDSTHFLIIDDNTPVATARYRQTDNGIKMERFAVLKEMRGKGYGLLILNHMIADLSNNKLVKYLHAQVQVVCFYEKVGFKKIG